MAPPFIVAQNRDVAVPVMKMIGSSYPLRPTRAEDQDALPWQPDVEDQAGGPFGGSDLRKSEMDAIGEHPGRAIATDAQPMREGRIVINDQDGGVCVGHRPYSRLKDQGNEPFARFAVLAWPCGLQASPNLRSEQSILRHRTRVS